MNKQDILLLRDHQRVVNFVVFQVQISLIKKKHIKIIVFEIKVDLLNYIYCGKIRHFLAIPFVQNQYLHSFLKTTCTLFKVHVLGGQINYK